MWGPPSCFARVVCLALALSCLALPRIAHAAPPPLSLDTAVTATQGASTQAERTRELATDLSGLVGVQVSPLLVLAVSGAWAIYEAERHEHPETRWYARRSFVLALLLLMSALFLARRLPFPLDKVAQGLKLFENKASALVGFFVFAPRLVDALVGPLGGPVQTASRWLIPVAQAAEGGAEGSDSMLVRILAWGLVFAAAFVVFLFSHAIHVLVLLSPFGFVDKALVAMRFVLLTVVVGSAFIHPVLGLVVCGAVVLVAALVAGWSFRWMVFGAVMAGDLLLGADGEVDVDGVRIFASAVPGVPARTYGRIRAEGQGPLVFTTRRFGIGPTRQVPLVGMSFAIERGLLAPVLRRADGVVVGRFPPRFATHEEALAAALGGLAVESHPVVQGLEAAVGWLRGLVEA